MGEAQTITFDVGGMHCASCGMLIDETLEALAGVDRSDTDSRRGRTIVRADLDVISRDEIVAGIAEAGYSATPRLG